MPPAALQVLEKLTTLQANAETIVNFLSDGEKVQQLRQDKAYNQQLLQRVRHCRCCWPTSLRNVHVHSRGCSSAVILCNFPAPKLQARRRTLLL